MPMFRLNPGSRMVRTCPGHNDSRAATDASSECERGHRGEECDPGLDPRHERREQVAGAIGGRK